MVCDEATHQVRDRGQEAMPSMAKIWYFCKKKEGGKGRIKAEEGKGEGDPCWLVHSSNACIGHDWSRLEQAEKMGLESKHSI